MLPDFNRLKVFYYVFLHRSVAVASAELNITASAVSQSLNKLERELTVLLFTRLHKKLVPTSAGDQLFEIVSPFIIDLEAGIRQIRQARQIPSGMIRVGSPIEFGISYFPKIFAAFRKKYPEVIFTMTLVISSNALKINYFYRAWRAAKSIITLSLALSIPRVLRFLSIWAIMRWACLMGSGSVPHIPQ